MEVRHAANTLQGFAGIYLNAYSGKKKKFVIFLNVNDVKTEKLLKIDKWIEQLSASDTSIDISVI